MFCNDISIPKFQIPNYSLDNKRFCKISHILLCVYFASSGLSFFISQFCVVILIFCSLLNFTNMLKCDLKNLFHKHLENNNSIYAFFVATLLWLFIQLFTSIFGVDFAHSLSRFVSSFFWFSFPFCVLLSFTASDFNTRSILNNITQYILLSGLSLSVANLCSFIQIVTGINLELGIPGPVTGSGQMVLILPMMFAILIYYAKIRSSNAEINIETSLFSKIFSYLIFCSGSFVLLMISFVWSSEFLANYKSTTICIFRIMNFCLIIILLYTLKKLILDTQSFSIKRAIFDPTSYSFEFIMLLSLLINITALVTNLKRGPWIAVIFELIILGFFLSRRIILNTLFCVGVVFICLMPARERLLNFADDFSIKGGRESMWQLGAELVQRFPLGVGLGNAKYMRTLDPSLPPSHRHMHNNLLNVTVESGWGGLLCYIWLIFIPVCISIKTYKLFFNKLAKLQCMNNIQLDLYAVSILSLCLALSIVGWQLAGLVEYNFGDGEVRFIAFAIIGFILIFNRLAKYIDAHTIS